MALSSSEFKSLVWNSEGSEKQDQQGEQEAGRDGRREGERTKEYGTGRVNLWCMRSQQQFEVQLFVCFTCCISVFLSSRVLYHPSAILYHIPFSGAVFFLFTIHCSRPVSVKLYKNGPPSASWFILLNPVRNLALGPPSVPPAVSDGSWCTVESPPPSAPAPPCPGSAGSSSAPGEKTHPTEK